MENEAKDCKCCYKEPSLGEIINSLPLESDLKDKMFERYKKIIDINEDLINQIRDCHSEIDRLERAVIILSKTLAKHHIEP